MKCLAAWLVILNVSAPTFAQSPSQVADATRPHYQLDQSNEDWEGLCDAATRGEDVWDPLKCVGLGRSSWYISFGGQVKGRYELFRNYSWGAGPQDPDGYYLNRILAHSDFNFGDHFRVFAEFESGLEFGRNGGPRPSIDQDPLDVSQLFLELTPRTGQEKTTIRLRLGRQELNYGDGSLVAPRELNVRRPFDGVRVIVRPDDWQIDIFAVQPVLTNIGTFDDVRDRSQSLWGVWLTHQKGRSFFKRVDLYYLGLDRKNGQFVQGIARERRNTVGVNTTEEAGSVSFAQEADVQIGTFGAPRLLAWKVVQGISCAWPRSRYRPVFVLQGALSSGDEDAKNARLETFNPLFPKGLYYGYMVFTSGSLNALVIHPALTMQLSEHVVLEVDSFSLWRQRITDGLYSQAGVLLRTGGATDARYVGSTQDVSIRWQVDRHTGVQLVAAQYEVGTFLRETNPQGRNTTYLTAAVSYTF